jgi:hypothetical protein
MIVPVTIDIEGEGAFRVHASFEVSLERHGIERPSLLFMKVEDTCRIDVDLRLAVDDGR